METTETTTWRSHWRPYAWALAGAWTLVIAGSLAWNLMRIKSEAAELASNQTRAAYQRDLSHRSWCETHGGVYVPVETQDFDLVLMGGTEAAVAIQRREQSSGAHMPIIAMRAHAMRGNRERCPKAGIRADELLRAIETAQALKRALGPITAEEAA